VCILCPLRFAPRCKWLEVKCLYYLIYSFAPTYPIILSSSQWSCILLLSIPFCLFVEHCYFCPSVLSAPLTGVQPTPPMYTADAFPYIVSYIVNYLSGTRFYLNITMTTTQRAVRYCSSYPYIIMPCSILFLTLSSPTGHYSAIRIRVVINQNYSYLFLFVPPEAP